MRNFALTAALLVAQPLPALAAEQPMTGLMHVTEVAPSGAAFQFWAASDVVGLHSRLKVEVAMTPAELRKRVEAMEAGTVQDDSDLESAVRGVEEAAAALAAMVDGALDRPDRSPGSADVAYGRRLVGLKRELARRAEASVPYKLVVRARLQHSTQGGWLPRKARPAVEARELTAPDAPPAFVVRRKPGAIPAMIMAGLDAALGETGRLAACVRRLDQGLAAPRLDGKQRTRLERLRARLRDLQADTRSLRPYLEHQSQLDGGTFTPGYIPEQAVLDLDQLPDRRAGDHVELQLVLTRDDEDVAVLEERTAVLHKVGLYPDAKLGVTFNTLGSWSPSLTLVAKWGYRTGFTASNTEMFGPQMRLRGMMSGGALMWNEVWDPGIALNLSGQGAGVGLSFFKELLQVGRGFNPVTGDFYWYGGLGLPFSLVDAVQQ